MHAPSPLDTPIPLPGDIAEHHDRELGPTPVVRALLGLLLGLAAGSLAALLTPRPQRAHRDVGPSQPHRRDASEP